MAAKPTVPGGTDTLQLHELVFYVPGEMNEEEFAALVESIKENGQQNSITLLDGKILDGRHRYRACQKLGIAPKVEQFDTKGKVSPVEFVMNANLHRRQLNSMQKALVAAHMYGADNTLTQEALAKRVGVGKGTVNLAVRLLDSKNTPLIKRAESGQATRAEIDEVLYDREHAGRATPTEPEELVEPDGDDPLDLSDPLDTAPSSAVGSKVPHPEHRATETTPSKLAGAFRKLSALDKTSFIQIAWAALEPALVAAGKLVATVAKLDPVANAKPKKKAVPAKEKKPAKK